jgi:hypothetical protein
MWHGHMAIRSANLLFRSFVYGRFALLIYTQLWSVCFACFGLMAMRF